MYFHHINIKSPIHLVLSPKQTRKISHFNCWTLQLRMGVTRGVQKLHRCPKPQWDDWKLQRPHDLCHGGNFQITTSKWGCSVLEAFSHSQCLKPRQPTSPLGAFCLKTKMVPSCCLNPLLYRQGNRGLERGRD